MRKNGGFKVQRGVRDTFFFCTRVWQLTTAKPKNAFIFLFFFLIFLLPELFHEKHAEKSREAQLQSALFSLFSKRPLQLSLSLSQSLRVPSTCRGYHRSSEQREERTENERHSDLLTFWLTSTRQGKKKKKRCADQRALGPSLISALCFTVVTPSFFSFSVLINYLQQSHCSPLSLQRTE